MKRLFLVVTALLPLVSCINVDDFGVYWNIAGMDWHLAGRWKRVAVDPDQTPEHGYPIGRIMQIVEKNGAYEMSYDRKTQDDRPLYPVKTLNVAPYQFLAIGPQKGLLERYRLGGRVLELCHSIGPALVEFVQAKHPKAVNMKKGEGEGGYMQIKVFDDEVFAILSEIPDTDEYWICDSKYERVP